MLWPWPLATTIASEVQSLFLVRSHDREAWVLPPSLWPCPTCLQSPAFAQRVWEQPTGWDPSLELFRMGLDPKKESSLPYRNPLPPVPGLAQGSLPAWASWKSTGPSADGQCLLPLHVLLHTLETSDPYTLPHTVSHTYTAYLPPRHSHLPLVGTHTSSLFCVSKTGWKHTPLRMCTHSLLHQHQSTLSLPLCPGGTANHCALLSLHLLPRLK